MMSENKVLTIFGPKMEDVAGAWRILRNKEPHNFYPTPTIIRVIKSRTMRWAGHISRTGTM
jgi:hypothetical protein